MNSIGVENGCDKNMWKPNNPRIRSASWNICAAERNSSFLLVRCARGLRSYAQARNPKYFITKRAVERVQSNRENCFVLRNGFQNKVLD